MTANEAKTLASNPTPFTEEVVYSNIQAVAEGGQFALEFSLKKLAPEVEAKLLSDGYQLTKHAHYNKVTISWS